jgi:hypothetical protein
VYLGQIGSANGGHPHIQTQIQYRQNDSPDQSDTPQTPPHGRRSSPAAEQNEMPNAQHHHRPGDDSGGHLVIRHPRHNNQPREGRHIHARNHGNARAQAQSWFGCLRTEGQTPPKHHDGPGGEDHGGEPPEASHHPIKRPVAPLPVVARSLHRGLPGHAPTEHKNPQSDERGLLDLAASSTGSTASENAWPGALRLNVPSTKAITSSCSSLRPRRRSSLPTRKRVMPHNQDRSFEGSRSAGRCFHAARKVSCARSSLRLKLPVAL